MTPMGWGALSQWGQDVSRIEPLAGEIANDVWSVRINGHLAVLVSAKEAMRISRGRPIFSRSRQPARILSLIIAAIGSKRGALGLHVLDRIGTRYGVQL
jgi:hypothetical protein